MSEASSGGSKQIGELFVNDESYVYRLAFSLNHASTQFLALETFV